MDATGQGRLRMILGGLLCGAALASAANAQAPGTTLEGRAKHGPGVDLVLPGYHVPLRPTDGIFVELGRDYMPQDPTTDQQAAYDAESPPTFNGTSHTLIHYWPPFDQDASPQIWGGAPHPVFVFVHGGGFFGGAAGDFFTQHDGDFQIGPKFRALQEAGYAIVSVDYNLSYYDPQGKLKTGLMRQIRQVRRAIQFLRFNAAYYNIDPDRVLIGGTSGGGMIALHVALGMDLQNPSGPGYEIMSSRPDRVFTAFGTQFFEDPTQPYVSPAEPGALAKCPEGKDFVLGEKYGPCLPEDPEQPVSSLNPCTYAGLDLALPATQNALDRIDLLRVVTTNGFDYAALGLESLLIVHSPLSMGIEQFPVVNNHSPLYTDFLEAALAANGTLPWLRVDEIHASCDKPPYVEKADSALGVQVLCHLGFDGPSACPPWPPSCTEFEAPSVECGSGSGKH